MAVGEMIVAGFGFRRDASAASLRDAFDRARGDHPVSGLATAADKAGTAQFRALSAALGLPACPVAPEALTPQATHTHSPRVAAARGTGSVAEAAALAAAGPGARPLAPRIISADRMASCALAMSLPEGQTQ